MSLALNTVLCDEEHRVVSLLDHAAQYCDELVVVVDRDSRDATYDLATEYGALTIIGPHSWYAEPLRPLARDHTNGDWILVLDGDETLSDNAIQVLTDLDRNQYKTAKLPRLNLVDGELFTNVLDPQVRWFQRDAVTYTLTPHGRIVSVHEQTEFAPKSPGWIIHAKTAAEVQIDRDREHRAAVALGRE